MRFAVKSLIVSCCAFIVMPSQAEGVIDVHTYVSGSANYDSNLFRFASKQEAQSAGFDRLSDVVKRVDVGLDANLRLSRQLVRFTANINDNRFTQNPFLDNIGRSVKLGWNWKLGSDVYGEVSTSHNQSIASFTDNDIINRNIRTFDRHRASVNWSFTPDWTAYSSYDVVRFTNDLPAFKNIDSEEVIYEAGLRYQSMLGNQFGMFYRLADTDFFNRAPAAIVFFGEASRQTQYGINVAWQASANTKLSTQLSWMDISRKGAPLRDFDGFNQRWTIDHRLTAKSSLNASVFREVIPIEDFLANFAELKGGNASYTWNMSPKMSVSTGVGYFERSFLGASLRFINAEDRNDKTKRANLTFTYMPTQDAQLQIAYLTEQRDSNVLIQNYSFQSINFLARYNF